MKIPDIRNRIRCRYPFLAPTSIWLLLFSCGFSSSKLVGDEVSPTTTEASKRWTTSHIVGSPDPPRPYTVERILSSQTWRSPVYVAVEPDSSHLLVIQQGGEADRPSQIVRIPDDPETTEMPTLYLELPRRLIYGLTFHPDFRTNGHVYIFSNGPTGEEERQNRIARFTVRHDEPRTCDPSSEHVILEWRSQGHDGGDLVFGHDQMLYITSGDGTSDSDGWDTGQDLRDLAGGVLRIDVDRPTESQAYSVPSDNPFVMHAGARPEIWAYGLRNPWRMTIDSRTGHIWVGNNGQDLWETAHFLGKGENYGWSVYEGSHPFHAQGSLGPTPPVPPTLEHSHAEARSLTGGVVYYGESLEFLQGAYVYGDYSTGKIWGARHDGNHLTWQQELADTSLQIAGFAVSRRGDLIVVDHAGGLYRLIPKPAEADRPPFPKKLSDTGLFTSVADHRMESGVLRYSINVPGWHDGATSEHYVAIPGDATIEFTPQRSWNLPEGSVLVQTLSTASSTPNRPPQRIETRILTRQQGEWNGYSYRWNEQQDDAWLVEANGDNFELPWTRDDTRHWRIPSRAECMTCHSRAVGYLLSMTTLQQTNDSPPVPNLMSEKWLFGTSLPSDSQGDRASLVDPYDDSQPLEIRVRSYLHTNCSGCHVEAGGGNSRMNLEFSQELSRMGIVDVRPLHDAFGIFNAALIAPGDPERSILYQRISRRGPGQMPPLVSHRVDTQAVKLVHDWIESLRPSYPIIQHWQMSDLLPRLKELTQPRNVETGKALYERLGCAQCHRFQQRGGGAGPELDEIGGRLSPEELLESLLDPSKKIAPAFAASILEVADGRIVEGRIIEQTAEHVFVQTSSSFAPRLSIRRDDIERQTVSQLSIMPTGMLDTLQPEQILDLLSYLRSPKIKD